MAADESRGAPAWPVGHGSWRAAAASLVAIVVIACQAPIGLGHGRVAGLVGAAPASPLGNTIAPAPGKTVLVVDAAGRTNTATTGSDGRYSIDLGPGTYEVQLKGYAPVQLYYGRNPNTYGQWPKATVVVGQVTKVDLIYDSRIR